MFSAAIRGVRRAAPTAGFSVVRATAAPRVDRRFMGGGGHDDHHGPQTLEPPFQRLPLPTGPLPEEHELIWHDGVAPEQCLDFDVPHVSTEQALLMWLGGFGFFFTLYQLVKTLDHPSNKESAKRELVVEDISRALGGRPKPESHRYSEL